MTTVRMSFASASDERDATVVLFVSKFFEPGACED